MLCLIAAHVSYYAWRDAVDGTIAVRYLSSVGLMWLLASVMTGAVGGCGGDRIAIRHLGVGVPAGVFAGEAAAVLFLRQRWTQVAIEGAIAGLLCTRTHGPTGIPGCDHSLCRRLAGRGPSAVTSLASRPALFDMVRTDSSLGLPARQCVHCASRPRPRTWSD